MLTDIAGGIPNRHLRAFVGLARRTLGGGNAAGQHHRSWYKNLESRTNKIKQPKFNDIHETQIRQ